MKRDVEMTEHVCDGCRKSWVINRHDELPLGFHGSTMWIHGSGGDHAEWFACSERCLRKAITAALARRDEDWDLDA